MVLQTYYGRWLPWQWGRELPFFSICNSRFSQENENEPGPPSGCLPWETLAVGLKPGFPLARRHGLSFRSTALSVLSKDTDPLQQAYEIT